MTEAFLERFIYTYSADKIGFLYQKTLQKATFLVETGEDLSPSETIKVVATIATKHENYIYIVCQYVDLCGIFRGNKSYHLLDYKKYAVVSLITTITFLCREL
jgi:hypothetical protein